MFDHQKMTNFVLCFLYNFVCLTLCCLFVLTCQGTTDANKQEAIILYSASNGDMFVLYPVPFK